MNETGDLFAFNGVRRFFFSVDMLLMASNGEHLPSTNTEKPFFHRFFSDWQRRQRCVDQDAASLCHRPSLSHVEQAGKPRRSLTVPVRLHVLATKSHAIVRRKTPYQTLDYLSLSHITSTFRFRFLDQRSFCNHESMNHPLPSFREEASARAGRPFHNVGQSG